MNAATGKKLQKDASGRDSIPARINLNCMSSGWLEIFDIQNGTDAL